MKKQTQRTFYLVATKYQDGSMSEVHCYKSKNLDKISAFCKFLAAKYYNTHWITLKEYRTVWGKNSSSFLLVK